MKKKKFEQLPIAALVLIDALVLGLALIVFALYDHAWPRSMEAEVSDETLELIQQIQARREQEALSEEPMIEAIAGKFSDKFTDGEPYWNGNTYVGRNLNVTLSDGKVGENVYYVQDIYVRDIECLQTAFGQDIYGKGYTEEAVALANRKGAVGAINGDFYYMGSLSVIIRNGELYRDSVDPMESVLVLYRNGNMKIFEEGRFTVADLIADGAWQTWSFGPSLIDAQGKAITEYTRKNADDHPRTAIGMFEPGHYMFIVVDGRQKGYSEGMTYVQLAELCETLGLKLAYNLDGGGSTRMVFNGQMVSSPCEERELSDIVFVTDVD